MTLIKAVENDRKQFEVYRLVEREDENGKIVKIKELEWRYTLERLREQETIIANQLKEVQEKIAQIEELNE